MCSLWVIRLIQGMKPTNTVIIIDTIDSEVAKEIVSLLELKKEKGTISFQCLELTSPRPVDFCRIIFDLFVLYLQGRLKTSEQIVFSKNVSVN